MTLGMIDKNMSPGNFLKIAHHIILEEKTYGVHAIILFSMSVMPNEILAKLALEETNLFHVIGCDTAFD
jgi:hypothetical protein